MLIILSGLPGAGKTTIAKLLAKKLKAVYLRIDSIEETLRRTLFSGETKFNGPEGYMVAFSIARDNLMNGLIVIADSVNPVELSRNQWRNTATEINVPFIEIEIICSNEKLHQQRVETRKTDIPGQILPTWQEVLNKDYEPWRGKHLIIDTATDSASTTVNKIISKIAKKPLLNLVIDKILFMKLYQDLRTLMYWLIMLVLLQHQNFSKKLKMASIKL